MIDITPLMARAAETGVPAAGRHDLGDGSAVDFEVMTDGAVTVLTPGWAAHWSSENGSGKLGVEFQPIPISPVSELEQGYIATVVQFRAFRNAGASVDEAAALTIALVRSGGHKEET